MVWGTVLILALIGATDPTRIGIAALLVSRPRPMANLLTFWLGGIAAGLANAVGVLILLRDLAVMAVHAVSSAAATPTLKHIQIAIGVLMMLGAALVGMGLSARQRALTPGGDQSARALQPGTPTAYSRLSTRAQEALEGKRLWLPFAVGLTSTMPPVESQVALAAIATSGAAFATQASAALVFVLVVLAIFEIPLISFLAAPARTRAVMLQLHNWLRTRRRRIIVVLLAVSGVALVASGL